MTDWASLGLVQGLLHQKTAQSVYGMAPGSEAEQEAQRLTEQYLHPGFFVATAGDVVVHDGRYVGYRASCTKGMSGGPVRILDRPGCIVGVHLGASGAAGLRFVHLLSAREPAWLGAGGFRLLWDPAAHQSRVLQDSYHNPAVRPG